MAITNQVDQLQTYLNQISNQIYTTSTASTTNHIWTTNTSTTIPVTVGGLMLAHREAAFFALDDEAVQQYIAVSKEFEYECPDGTVLKFTDGNVEIFDDNSKLVYKSNPIREFNKYLNASDLLEEFIQYCNTQKIKQSEFMDLPIELFIMWLVVRTAEQDGEDPGDMPLQLEDKNKAMRTMPHCLYCGRFIPKARHRRGINFCNGTHMDLYGLT